MLSACYMKQYCNAIKNTATQHINSYSNLPTICGISQFTYEVLNVKKYESNYTQQ